MLSIFDWLIYKASLIEILLVFFLGEYLVKDSEHGLWTGLEDLKGLEEDLEEGLEEGLSEGLEESLVKCLDEGPGEILRKF